MNRIERTPARLPKPDTLARLVRYYTTERGYHERSLNSNGGSTVTYPLSFINAPILHYLDELDSAVHIDLYDDVDVIPWDVIEEFLGRHLA